MAMRCTITMAAALVVEAALLNGLLHGSQHCLLVALTAHGELASGMRALDVVHALALWKSIHRGKDLLLTITAVHSFDVHFNLGVATVALGVAVVVRHDAGFTSIPLSSARHARGSLSRRRVVQSSLGGTNRGLYVTGERLLLSNGHWDMGEHELTTKDTV
jgi:hypothetical protein